MLKEISEDGEGHIPITERHLKELFERYFGQLVYYTKQFGVPPDEAKDITIGAFHRIWEQRAKQHFPDEKSIRSYLYINARNAAISYLRRNKTASHFLNDFRIIEDQPVPSQEEMVILSERSAIRTAAVATVFGAIDKLPEQYKKVIIGAMEGKSSVLLAREMEITESSVRGYKLKAIQSLRQIIVSKWGVIPTLLIMILCSCRTISVFVVGTLFS